MPNIPENLPRRLRLLFGEEIRDPANWPPEPEPRGRCYVEHVDPDTPLVPLQDEPLDEIWWRGRQWAVTAYGIEHLSGGYAIEAARLVEELNNDYGNWPLHLAEKDQPDLDDFITAWLVALTLHGKRAPAARVREIIALCPVSTAEEEGA